MSSREVRVRFAPSPTGFLHIGGVRAALYNWLYARKHHGKFLLRIEDTDLERSEDQYTQDILSCLRWVGLTWDEELVFQGKRLDIYKQKAEELVARGNAYYCTCTEEDVEKMREEALKKGEKPQYNRRCRDKDIQPVSGTPYVIRAKIPLEGDVEFEDLIRGQIKFENKEIDDFVLIRSNGAPTYNLSVVVDDVEMKMTHIIRGDDHINNTPKQLHLYYFFEYQQPKFAHLPMILGSDKKKLSKRNGDVSTNFYRGAGYLPEALLNFLVRLGWSHGDQEVFTIAEMIQHFDFAHVQKSGAVFNAEKLLWLNGEHMRKTAPDRLLSIVVSDFSDYFSQVALNRLKTPMGEKLVALIQPKVKLVKELAEQLVPLCAPGVVEVDPSGLKWNKDANLKIVLQAAILHMANDLSAKMKTQHADPEDTLMKLSWTHQDVDQYLRQLATERGVKLGELIEPIRLGVTGRMVSASVFEVLTILPWSVVEARLRKIASI